MAKNYSQLKQTQPSCSALMRCKSAQTTAVTKKFLRAKTFLLQAVGLLERSCY
jgi:hypothetical protein